MNRLSINSVKRNGGNIRIVGNSMISACYSTKSPDVPKNTLANSTSSQHQSEAGRVYDKRPFQITLEAGKRYNWCLCGFSHSQPFCDGTHKNQEMKIKQRPVAFQVEETKSYWLCNCKQTNNRPFCDGTHKTPKVQNATSVIKN